MKYVSIALFLLKITKEEKKYRFIFCRTVEICFHTFTTRHHTSSGRVVEFVVWLLSASCSFYIACFFSNHPLCVFIVHSAKMTKKKLLFGALPTVNKPRWSHDSNPQGGYATVFKQKRISEIACYKFHWNSRVVDVS